MGCFGRMTLLALALAMVAGLTRAVLEPWQFMWIMAAALWLGFKLMMLGRTRNPVRPLLFLFWPGMDPGPFQLPPVNRRPHFAPFLQPVASVLLGACLVLVVIPLTPFPLLQGWLGFAAMLCLLHFGLFDWMARGWNQAGIPVQPLMDQPWRARTPGEFWGRRWNRGFSDWARPVLFRRLTRKLGSGPGVMAGFLTSGLLHELVISLPAGAGYGLPTLYFAIQGSAVLLERLPRAQTVCRNPAATLAWVLLPSALLLHPPFLGNVMVPMLQTLPYLMP